MVHDPQDVSCGADTQMPTVEGRQRQQKWRYWAPKRKFLSSRCSVTANRLIVVFSFSFRRKKRVARKIRCQHSIGRENIGLNDDGKVLSPLIAFEKRECIWPSLILARGMLH